LVDSLARQSTINEAYHADLYVNISKILGFVGWYVWKFCFVWHGGLLRENALQNCIALTSSVELGYATLDYSLSFE
jgi:hypothetical protein